MKNRISYLLFTLFFIFSCSEAKFGFREKVKVEGHSIVKTNAKPHLTNPDEKKVDIDSFEIITANSSDENLILPQTLPSATILKKLPPSLPEKKSENNIHKKNRSISPDTRQLNIPAFIGALLVFVGFFVLYLTTKLHSTYLVIYVLFAFTTFIMWFASYILSIIGLIQITNHREKYSGLGFAIFGVVFGSLFLIYLFLAIYLFSNL